MDEVTIKTAAAIQAVKAMLDAMKEHSGPTRSFAVCCTQFETGFLWAANAVGGEPIL